MKVNRITSYKDFIDNHEIWCVCDKCGFEYDLRKEWKCPKCGNMNTEMK